MSDPTPAMRPLAEAARRAARQLQKTSTETRRAALGFIADALAAHTPTILAANALDMHAAAQRGLAPAMLDRLALSPTRVQGLIGAVRNVAASDDPIGRLEQARTRPDGLTIAKQRIPLGVVAMIYEARPGVTVDAAVLCVWSGNACILRGGSEAFHSNQALAVAVAEGLALAGLPTSAVQVVPTTDRASMIELLQLDDLIDVAIPRGGEGLIRFVSEHARVPVIKHYKGVCHVYIHAAAQLEMAMQIVDNAKTQRPGVCNAAETVLIDSAIAAVAVPALVARLGTRVELRGDPAACALGGPIMRPATEADWQAEYLDLILAVRIVDNLDAAIAHIEAYGSNHTEAIVTDDTASADRFLREVNSSTVMVNASTRFADGGELGLGAEIGISTSKLHAYGPMGAEGLTTTKFVVVGHGHVRT